MSAGGTGKMPMFQGQRRRRNCPASLPQTRGRSTFAWWDYL